MTDAELGLMYPTMMASTPAAAPPPAAAAPTSEAGGTAEPRQASREESLAALYPTMSRPPVDLSPPPPVVAELRESRRDLTQAYPSLTEQLGAPFGDNIEMPPEQVRTLRAELGNLFSDIGATPRDAEYAAAAATAYRKAPPSATQVAAMQDEARQQLSSIYGEGAHQALKDAQALAKRDPRMLAFLEATGLANDPKFVVRMAEMARAERLRGRLV